MNGGSTAFVLLRLTSVVPLRSARHDYDCQRNAVYDGNTPTYL